MGTFRRICIAMAIAWVSIAGAAQAGTPGPVGMFYRTAIDENLGFSITVPVYWYIDAARYPPDRSHIGIMDPFSQSAIAIDCVWARNDAFPYYYGLNWPGNDTMGHSVEISRENDGLVSVAGKHEYNGSMNYYLYDETRFPGRGNSKFEYAVTSVIPDPGPVSITDNDLIVEQAIGSVRIFDPGQPQKNFTPVPLYPGMIESMRRSEIIRADEDR